MNVLSILSKDEIEELFLKGIISLPLTKGNNALYWMKVQRVRYNTKSRLVNISSNLENNHTTRVGKVYRENPFNELMNNIFNQLSYQRLDYISEEKIKTYLINKLI